MGRKSDLTLYWHFSEKALNLSGGLLGTNFVLQALFQLNFINMPPGGVIGCQNCYEGVVHISRLMVFLSGSKFLKLPLQSTFSQPLNNPYPLKN